jgi:serine/threonine-protein kinase
MPPDGSTLRPPWLDAPTPRAGRYVLGPLLGQGGVGEVREAWDPVLQRTVALKILRRMDPDSVVRFLREAQAQSRVNHPNICQIYDVDSSEGAPRIAMQLVRGPTLADAAGDLSVDACVQIMIQVAGAVHAAHRLRLIHRDLKPSNILLERGPDGGWIPYVCDFGLAIAPEDATLTAPQWVHGTPAYMAPEQRRGERAALGPATDVFALGGTLRFALRGGLDLPDPTAPRRRGTAPAGMPTRRTIPAGLRRILGHCLEPDPALRYPSAAALAEDLARFRAGLPVLAHPAGGMERLGWLGCLGCLGCLGRLWQRRRRPRPRTLALVLAAATLLAGAALAQGRQAASLRSRAHWERLYGDTAQALERELSLERMQPAHDLRPTYADLRFRLARLQSDLPAQGPEAQGAGHQALGQIRLLLGDFPGAWADLDLAWKLGCRSPGLAGLQARALVGLERQAQCEASFATGLARVGGGSNGPAAQMEALIHRASGAGTDDFLAAQASFLRGDYGKAFGQARLGLLARPWEAAGLQSMCLTGLGREAFRSGDGPLAEARFRAAMAVAQRFLEAEPSDEPIRHAYLLAGRGLALLQQDRQGLSPAFLAGLQAFSGDALDLDPDNPDLQDDWLAVQGFKAVGQAQRGADPRPVLAAALAFLDRRGRPPLPVTLRAERMLLLWQQAVCTFRRGGDPGPALGRALQDGGHTSFLGQDFLGDVLAFRARVEAARGQDPRPTLAEALARLRPQLGQAPPPQLCRTAAQLWRQQAQWEAARGLDAGASRIQALAWAGRAGSGALDPVPERRQQGVQIHAHDAGGPVAHGVGNDHLPAVDEPPAAVHHVGHIAFTAAALGFDEGFPQPADDPGGILQVQQDRAYAVLAHRPHPMGKHQPAAFRLHGRPAVADLD